MELPLPLQSYPAYSTRENCQSLINLFALQDTSSSTTVGQVSLYPTPGLSLFATLDSTNGRKGMGCITVGSTVYAVYQTGSQTIFGTLSSTGVWTQKGVIGTASVTSICMAAVSSSGVSQIVIATGGTGYLYDIVADSLATITSNFPANVSWVTAANGFFIALKPGSNTFYVSDVLNGATWQSLNFASANTTYSNLVSAAVLNQQLFLFTEQTTEIWYNVGQLFPFASQQGNFLNTGCAAPKSVVYANNNLYWLAQAVNGARTIVKAAPGNTYQQVSNKGINDTIAGYSTVADCTAFSYSLKGNEFIVFIFPTAGKSWQLNTETGMWNELKSTDATAMTQPSYTRFRGAFYTFVGGQHLVMDYNTSKIFKLDTTVFTEDTVYPMLRTFVTPNFTYSDKIIRIYSLQVFVEPGQGLSSGTGSSPLLGLEISRDGGFTYGNQRVTTLGKLGQYSMRSRWNLLGAARNFVFRFSTADPIKLVVLGMKANFIVQDEGAPLTQGKGQ